DGGGDAFDDAGDDGGDGCAVEAFGILVGAENVEIAQRNRFHIVELSVDGEIELADVFGDGVGADGGGELVFALGELGLIAVGGGGGGVNDFSYAGLARGFEELEGTGAVDFVVFDGHLNRLRDRG